MSELEIKFDIETSFNPDFIILSSYETQGDDRRRLMCQDRVALKERAVREVLIKLGWTPPPE